MKKIILIIILLLCIGCNGEENQEVIKYRLNDNEKIVIELKKDSDLHYSISEYFYITYQEELFGSINFLSLENCKEIKDNKDIEIIKEDTHGFTYKDDNYHYINMDNKVCISINAKELDNLNKIVDNISIRVEKES